MISTTGAPRVFLHVGSPKTGTTFLQQVIWSQRELAAQQGLTLPLSTFHDQFLATLDVRGLGGRAPHPSDSAGAWNRLVADALTHSGNVLVSHELFAAASKDQARKAVGWFGTGVEVHVVITARDLVRQVSAEWQEHVKHRAVVDLEGFVHQLRTNAAERKGWFWLVQDYADLVSRWGSTLPPERVHIVTVPPEGSSRELLWERFAGLIGLDPASFDTESSRTNTSLGGEQAEVLRRVNVALGDRLPFPGPYAGVAKDVLAHRVLAGRDGTKLALKPGDTEFARVESQRIADALAASGVDIVGSLDDLVPAVDEIASSENAYEQATASVLLEESIAALADLLVVMAERVDLQQHQGEVIESLRRNPLKAALSQAGEERPKLGRALGAVRKLRQS